MSGRWVLAVALVMVGLPLAALAEGLPRVEITPFFGYRFGGGLEDAETGEDFELDDSAYSGGLLDLRLGEATQLELYYSRQETELQSEEGLFHGRTLLDLDVEYYHVGGTYVFTEGPWQPFVVGTVGYFLSSVNGGRLLALLGVGRLLALSSLLTALALMGYALSPAWEVMVALSFVSGLAAGALDAGLNTYGAATRSERLIQWPHASFGVGSTLGPIIMTTGLNLFGAWRAGYVVVGVAQLALAGCFAVTASLWRQNGTAGEADAPMRLTAFQTPLRATLRERGAWLSILMFFIFLIFDL